jgi:hypothetical protein
MTENGPHPAALDAIDRFYAGDENKLRRGIARNGALIAHDPTLGRAASVNLGWVLDFIENEAGDYGDWPPEVRDAFRRLVEYIEEAQRRAS